MKTIHGLLASFILLVILSFIQLLFIGSQDHTKVKRP